MHRSGGVIAAIGAYVMWGTLPIYWKTLEHVSAPEILCHRMVWSLIFTFLLVICMKRWRDFLGRFKDKKVVTRVFLTGCLLAGNWLIYIWAVNSGHILEASLGYYINPLVAICLAVVVLKERLRPGQYCAIAIAAAGVLYLTVSYGQFPWIALSLACSFAVYGILHKTTDIPALEGLGMETVPLFLPASGVLFYLSSTGEGTFTGSGTSTSILLVFTGVATSVPLLLFGYAAKKIPFSLLGLLQYIAPTISFFIGIFVYSENFPKERMVGFSLVWIALAVYLGEGWLVKIKHKKQSLS